MTWFLLKGLLRDRQRSLFPIIIVAAGVTITVVLYSFMLGMADDLVQTNAKLDTGHVKIMTRGYAEIAGQFPNDLALVGLSELLPKLVQEYPDMFWVPRIRFGGLLDLPNARGETRAQGPVLGIGVDLVGPNTTEVRRLGLESALVQGRLPSAPGEIITSEMLANNLDVQLGDMATLIGSTANGSMAIQNFTVVGTIHFGIAALDRNAMLADLADIQYALDMQNSAGEVLGYFKDDLYRDARVKQIIDDFGARFSDPQDEWSPTMIALTQQNGLGTYLELVNQRILIVVAVFVLVMSIVLWNAGLMSGLRRYGEIGVRLAFGESKGHVYRSLIWESMLIGAAGSAIGTLVGLAISYYLEAHGIDLSKMMEGSAMLWANVMRARVTLVAYYIGFMPGLIATMLGALASGIGIFKRQTSQLFKELET